MISSCDLVIGFKCAKYNAAIFSNIEENYYKNKLTKSNEV